jgi:hypothetical protein
MNICLNRIIFGKKSDTTKNIIIKKKPGIIIYRNLIQNVNFEYSKLFLLIKSMKNVSIIPHLNSNFSLLKEEFKSEEKCKKFLSIMINLSLLFKISPDTEILSEMFAVPIWVVEQYKTFRIKEKRSDLTEILKNELLHFGNIEFAIDSAESLQHKKVSIIDLYFKKASISRAINYIFSSNLIEKFHVYFALLLKSLIEYETENELVYQNLIIKIPSEKCKIFRKNEVYIYNGILKIKPIKGNKCSYLVQPIFRVTVKKPFLHLIYLGSSKLNLKYDHLKFLNNEELNTKFYLTTNIDGKDRLSSVSCCVATNPFIKNVTLSNLSLSDICIEKLCKSFLNKSIISLNLSFNQISDLGAKLISNVIYNNQSIKSLILNGNFIANEGAKYLFKSTKKYKVLEILSLNYNKLNKYISYPLFDFLNTSSLLELHISNNNLEDKGIFYITKALKNNRLLKAISLHYTNMTPQGYALALANLKKNESLSILFIGLLDIEESARRLFTFLFENYFLSEISINLKFRLDGQLKIFNLFQVKELFLNIKKLEY